MSTPKENQKKEQIKGHLAQLEDMAEHYPEGYKCFELLRNHLRGLLNVKSTHLITTQQNSIHQNQAV